MSSSISHNLKTPLILGAIVVIHVAIALYLLLPRGSGSREADTRDQETGSTPEEVDIQPDPEEPPEPAYETYTVQRNDNLTVIARRHGTTLSEIRSLNNLTSDVIHPGQQLRVPARPDSGNGE